MLLIKIVYFELYQKRFMATKKNISIEVILSLEIYDVLNCTIQNAGIQFFFKDFNADCTSTRHEMLEEASNPGGFIDLIQILTSHRICMATPSLSPSCWLR